MTFLAFAAQRLKAQAKKKKRLAKSKRLGLNGARTLKGRRKKADTLFAAYIRERDGSQCRICGGDSFPQCSHFISRKFNGTRFDMENADCFCAKCHLEWEHKKEVEYRDWKLSQLGLERYTALIERRDRGVTLQEAVTEFFEWHQRIS